MSDPSPRASSRSRSWWVLAALALVALGILAPSVFLGRIVSSADMLLTQEPWRHAPEVAPAPTQGQHSDPVFYFEPWLTYSAEQLAQGEVPLRNPLSALGAPHLGSSQSAVLSPFSVPYYLLPWPVASWLAAFAKLFLAGAGAVLLARRLGRSHLAAFAAGIGYGLSGFVVLWLSYPLASSLVPLPWSLLGVLLLGDRPRVGVPLLALSLAVSVWGGHPECAFQAGTLAGLFFLWEWRGQPKGQRTRFFGRGAWAGLAGGLLAAPQALPFLEYLGESNALAARTDPVFRALRMAHPPALGSWLTGVLLLGLLWLAVKCLLVAGAHQRRVARMSPVVTQSPHVRHGDFLLAVLGGGFLAWYLRGALLSGAWNLFPLLVDPHYYGFSDLAPAPDRYSGPIHFIELNGAYLGASLLLLALLSPALTAARDRRFRFLFGGFLLALLVSADAPPFAQLLHLVPPFDVTVNRRFLAVGALLGALLAAGSLDGLRQLAEGRARQAALGLAALAVAALAGVAALDAERLPDRTGAAEVPELLPRPLGTPAGHISTPHMKSFVQTDDLLVEGFALSVEPLARVTLRMTSLVDGSFVEQEVTADRSSPVPRNETLLRYPRARNSGFQARFDLAGFPGGDADLDLVAEQADGTSRLLLRHKLRLCRPVGFRRAWMTLPLALLGLWWAARGRRRALGLGLLVCSAVGDLGWFAWQHVPQIPQARHYPAFPELPHLRTEDGSRLATPPDLLPPNTHLSYGLSSVHGKDVVDSRALRRLMDQMNGGGVPSALSRAIGLDLANPMTPLAGIGRILVPRRVPVDPAEARPVFTDEHYQVLAPARPGVRARVYHRVAERGPDERPRQVLERLGADAREVLVLPPGTLATDGRSADGPAEDARLLGDSSNGIRVEIPATDGPAWLLVTDLLLPGFEARVDDAPARVVAGFDALLAVELAPSDRADRVVELRYRPPSWRRGLGAGLGGLLLLLLAAWRAGGRAGSPSSSG